MFKKEEPVVMPRDFEDAFGNEWRLESLEEVQKNQNHEEENVLHVSRTYHAVLQRLDESGENTGAPYVLFYKFPSSYLRSNFITSEPTIDTALYGVGEDAPLRLMGFEIQSLIAPELEPNTGDVREITFDHYMKPAKMLGEN